MRDRIRECVLAGHADGLAAGLTLALEGMAASAAPGPVAAFPAAAVPAGAAVFPHDIAARQGVTFVPRGIPRPVPDGQLTALGARLAAVRLGVSRRLREHAVEHLAARVADGERTIRKQLVQGALADAAVAAESALQCLLVAGHLAVAVADTHDRLTALDWELAKLLGASGFADDPGTPDTPAAAAYVSRLAANCWLPRWSTDSTSTDSTSADPTERGGAP
jgi:hypothetical protein